MRFWQAGMTEVAPPGGTASARTTEGALVDHRLADGHGEPRVVHGHPLAASASARTAAPRRAAARTARFIGSPRTVGSRSQTRLACGFGSHCGPTTCCGSHDQVHRLASHRGVSITDSPRLRLRLALRPPHLLPLALPSSKPPGPSVPPRGPAL